MKAGEKYCIVSCANPQLVITVTGKGKPVIISALKFSNEQKFQYIDNAIISCANQLAIDISKGEEKGMPIIQWDKKNTNNQKWTLFKDKSIRSPAGLCLDINRGRIAEGTELIAWSFTGKDNQLWSIIPAEKHSEHSEHPKKYAIPLSKSFAVVKARHPSNWKQITKYDFTLPSHQLFRAMIIADCHIGQNHFDEIPKNTNKLLGYINDIIHQVRPTLLFVLGDIFHYNKKNSGKIWHNFFSGLEQFQIETYVIPGNHEEVWIKDIENYQGMYVKLLRLILEWGGPILIFGHHLENDRGAHKLHEVRQWFRDLRDEFREAIPPDALMVLGHVHGEHCSEDNLSYCVRPLSIENSQLYYGVVEYSKEVHGFTFVQKQYQPH